MRGFLKHGNYEIEYFEYGIGSQILFAFHGFNNHAEDFKALGDFMGMEYRIVAINLFFHGDSRAQSDLVEKGFSTDDLKTFFNEISRLFPAEKYSLMGYSLGGRFAMKLLEVVPERLKEIILIAPDGIRISLFYRFLTGTFIGKKLLKRVIDHPSFFFSLASGLKKLGLVSEKKYQFAMGNFDSQKKREKVYLVWMVLRKILSEKSTIKNIISRNNIPMHLFFGRYDNIIPPSIGKNFQSGMGKNISLTILESGHRLLKEKTLSEIAEKLREIKNDAR